MKTLTNPTSVTLPLARPAQLDDLCNCGGCFVMENQNEIWKPIKGHDCYFISNFGNVKSEGKKGHTRNRGNFLYRTLILKPSITNWGYCRVVLQFNGERKHMRVHRLVADAFIPNPENKPHVNHKDGNKRNNSAQNLEWVTNKENQEHAFKTGLKKIENGKFTKIKPI